MDCLFCKICKHQLKSEIVHESEKLLVLKDINPKATTHLLVVPKKHIVSLADIKGKDWQIVSEMMQTGEKMAKEFDLKGHKIVFNVGKKGGQVIDHIHMHLLSGDKIELP
jgi:histidine triad (HIT) family protein